MRALQHNIYAMHREKSIDGAEKTIFSEWRDGVVKSASALFGSKEPLCCRVIVWVD